MRRKIGVHHYLAGSLRILEVLGQKRAKWGPLKAKRPEYNRAFGSYPQENSSGLTLRGPLDFEVLRVMKPLKQGWANFSEQGPHSQIPSFKGPHIGWPLVSTYENSLIYAWFFLKMQALGQLNDKCRCRSPIQSWKPLTCRRSHVENHRHCAEK